MKNLNKRETQNIFSYAIVIGKLRKYNNISYL